MAAVNASPIPPSVQSLAVPVGSVTPPESVSYAHFIAPPVQITPHAPSALLGSACPTLEDAI